MALKKMRTKTKKNIKKRIKVTAGGKGKLLINRANHNHLRIKKSRKRVLKYKRDTEMSEVHSKLKTAI